MFDDEMYKKDEVFRWIDWVHKQIPVPPDRRRFIGGNSTGYRIPMEHQESGWVEFIRIKPIPGGVKIAASLRDWNNPERTTNPWLRITPGRLLAADGRGPLYRMDHRTERIPHWPHSRISLYENPNMVIDVLGILCAEHPIIRALTVYHMMRTDSRNLDSQNLLWELTVGALNYMAYGTPYPYAFTTSLTRDERKLLRKSGDLECFISKIATKRPVRRELLALRRKYGPTKLFKSILALAETLESAGIPWDVGQCLVSKAGALFPPNWDWTQGIQWDPILKIFGAVRLSHFLDTNVTELELVESGSPRGAHMRCRLRLLRDIARALAVIRQNAGEVPRTRGGNLIKVHNTITLYAARLKQGEFIIDESPLAQAVRKQVHDRTIASAAGEITLVVPHLNTDLIQASNQMLICVGSGHYAERMHEGLLCIILGLRGGQYALCAEVHGNPARITQCVLPRNQPASEEKHTLNTLLTGLIVPIVPYTPPVTTPEDVDDPF